MALVIVTQGGAVAVPQKQSGEAAVMVMVPLPPVAANAWPPGLIENPHALASGASVTMTGTPAIVIVEFSESAEELG